MIHDEMMGEWSEVKEGTLQNILLSVKTGIYRGRQYMEKYFKQASLMYFWDSRNN